MDSDTTWFWEIVDQAGLADVPSDECAALSMLVDRCDKNGFRELRLKSEIASLREGSITRIRDLEKQIEDLRHVAKTDAIKVLRLAYSAMNYMGDTMNSGHVTPEDEAATTPAFKAVRDLLSRAEGWS